MSAGIHFLLNDREVQTSLGSGVTLLDYIRKEQRLCGTKIGCREGDCGACTILVGDLSLGRLRYRSMTSCLMPLANVNGKHIVTIEGLNREQLTPVQQAVVDEGGTQCGFCTVGFIVSFAGHCLSHKASSYEETVAAIDGNICRCTGYKSLERAARRIDEALAEKDLSEPISWLVDNEFLPEYFRQVPQRLQNLSNKVTQPQLTTDQIIGGGTDLLVQRPEQIRVTPVTTTFDRSELGGIQETDGRIVIGASATAEDIKQSPLMQQYFPKIGAFMTLVSSTPIRNMGTVAGNLVNASPIGDLTCFFLALNTTLHLRSGENRRELPLDQFYKGYKQLELKPGEIIEQLSFTPPTDGDGFNFEKVSKRTCLDIASVNSAMSIRVGNGKITDVHLSAGGVNPIPTYLSATREYLLGKPLDEATVAEAAAVAQTEIAPISDARGHADYKCLLLRQLLFAHFLELYPDLFALEALV